MHVGGVAIFRLTKTGLDYDRLVELIDAARAGRAGGQRHLQAVLQRRGHQRAGAAVPALRGGGKDVGDVPGSPAAKGQALAIGLTAYDGGVFYGFNADRDAMPDINTLVVLASESLDELLGTVG